MDRSRRHDLDALRAVAMLLGIVLHVALSFATDFPWAIKDSQQSNLYGLLFFFIHGFRMPLFFMLSGFFSAMLWHRRGTKSLVKHRFLRVFLPLVVGLVTIIPLSNWILGFTSNSTPMPRDTSTLEQEMPRSASNDIWTAAALGDTAAVQQHLQNEVNINTPDPVVGITPLAWAALTGQSKTVAALIDSGADVNQPNVDGSTPVHAAALFARNEIIALLIDSGGNASTTNNNGQTPLDVALLDLATTLELAKLLRIEVDISTLTEARPQAIEQLQQATASADQSWLAPVGAWLGVLLTMPLLQHLWFLWLLFLLVVLFSIFVALTSWMPTFNLPAWLMLSPVRYLWIVPITIIPQLFMADGGAILTFGPDTSTSIWPLPHVLAYYAIFFGFGALYFKHINLMQEKTGKVWIVELALALLVVFPLGILVSVGEPNTALSLPSEVLRVLSVVLQALFPWMMIFAVAGLFRWLFAQENRAMRYLSDSSYWLYLAHLPLIFVGQWLVRDWNVPAGFKFLFLMVGATLILLLSYHLLVRNTPIGTFLNGPRKRLVRTSVS